MKEKYTVRLDKDLVNAMKNMHKDNPNFSAIIEHYLLKGLEYEKYQETNISADNNIPFNVLLKLIEKEYNRVCNINNINTNERKAITLLKELKEVL